MAMKKAEAGNVTCGVCGAENPADYTFCFACKATPSTGAKKASKKTSAKKKKR